MTTTKRQTSFGTVYERTLEHPLTREQRTIKATHRNDGEWVIRVYTADDVYDVQRTRELEEARAHWRHIERRLAVSGFRQRGGAR